MCVTTEIWHFPQWFEHVMLHVAQEHSLWVKVVSEIFLMVGWLEGRRDCQPFPKDINTVT